MGRKIGTIIPGREEVWVLTHTLQAADYAAKEHAKSNTMGLPTGTPGEFNYIAITSSMDIQGKRHPGHGHIIYSHDFYKGNMYFRQIKAELDHMLDQLEREQYKKRKEMNRKISLQIEFDVDGELYDKYAKLLGFGKITAEGKQDLKMDIPLTNLLPAQLRSGMITVKEVGVVQMPATLETLSFIRCYAKEPIKIAQGVVKPKEGDTPPAPTPSNIPKPAPVDHHRRAIECFEEFAYRLSLSIGDALKLVCPAIPYEEMRTFLSRQSRQRGPAHESLAKIQAIIEQGRRSRNMVKDGYDTVVGTINNCCSQLGLDMDTPMDIIAKHRMASIAIQQQMSPYTGPDSLNTHRTFNPASHPDWYHWTDQEKMEAIDRMKKLERLQRIEPLIDRKEIRINLKGKDVPDFLK